MFEEALDYVDMALGASRKFRNKVSEMYIYIGMNNVIEKQEVKVQTEAMVLDYQTFLKNNNFVQSTNSARVSLAESYLSYLKNVQVQLNILSSLNRDTVTSSTFSVTEKGVVESEIGSLLSQVNAQVLTLDSSLESAKSQLKQQNRNVISAENSLKSAQSQLSLARANAQNQINTAANQLRTAGKAQTDLDVRAPFAGTISKRMVTEQATVNFGQGLFEIVAQDVLPEIVTYLSPAEASQMALLSETRFRGN